MSTGIGSPIPPATPGFANPMTTAGDMIDGGAAGAAQRLAVGGSHQLLGTAAGTAPTWEGDTVWNAVGAAEQPAFLNGWANFGGGNIPLQFRKLAGGLVIVEGALTAAAASAIGVFTLPAGYRPSAQIDIPCNANTGGANTMGLVVILANGSFSTETAAGGVPSSYVQLSVCFFADA